MTRPRWRTGRNILLGCLRDLVTRELSNKYKVDRVCLLPILVWMHIQAPNLETGQRHVPHYQLCLLLFRSVRIRLNWRMSASAAIEHSSSFDLSFNNNNNCSRSPSAAVPSSTSSNSGDSSWVTRTMPGHLQQPDQRCNQIVDRCRHRTAPAAILRRNASTPTSAIDNANAGSSESAITDVGCDLYTQVGYVFQCFMPMTH